MHADAGVLDTHAHFLLLGHVTNTTKPPTYPPVSTQLSLFSWKHGVEEEEGEKEAEKERTKGRRRMQGGRVWQAAPPPPPPFFFFAIGHI